jgi:hypothetical protein
MLRSLFAARAKAPAATAGDDEAERRRQFDLLTKRVQQLQRIGTQQLYLMGEMARERILADPRYDDPLRLERHGLKVYSQNEEDGIISEILRRIGVADRTFWEFGVQDGTENNTLYRLVDGWRGAWIEGSGADVARIRDRFAAAVRDGRLQVREALVDRDNVNALVAELGLPRELDLLSIDIDGNDFHVWEALDAAAPRAVVIEYNPKLPPPTRWVMHYDPRHAWDGTDQYGASLAALAALGERKGYRLVACNITGSNAFFVRADLAGGKFPAATDPAYYYQPHRAWLTPTFWNINPVGFGKGGLIAP